MSGFFSGKEFNGCYSFLCVYNFWAMMPDSFKFLAGKEWFEKAQKIAQNAQSHHFDGWFVAENLRNRTTLVDELLRKQSTTEKCLLFLSSVKGWII